MTPFNLEQALAGKPFTNDKGWTVEDWHYFKGAGKPISILWREYGWTLAQDESELFMLPEKKKVWIVVWKSETGLSIVADYFLDKNNADCTARSCGDRYLETIEKEYEL